MKYTLRQRDKREIRENPNSVTEKKMTHLHFTNERHCPTDKFVFLTSGDRYVS